MRDETAAGQRCERAADAGHTGQKPTSDWWDELLPSRKHSKPPGAEVMLRVIAYDIAEPRRLQRVAKICEDFGARVQFSVFEFWLEDDVFERLWARLCETIEPETDRLLAMTLDARASRSRRTAGATMKVTEAVRIYLA